MNAAATDLCAEPDHPLPEGGFLVIGFGNPLRGDDGVGPVVAEALDELRLPGVRTLARQQLTPELVGILQEVDTVVFVDALPIHTSSSGPALPQALAPTDALPVTLATGALVIRCLQGGDPDSPLRPPSVSPRDPIRTGEWSGHRFSPGTLLALARELDGRAPAAWLVGIPLQEFGWGIGLTHEASRRVTDAIEAVRRLWARWYAEREPHPPDPDPRMPFTLH